MSYPTKASCLVSPAWDVCARHLMALISIVLLYTDITYSLHYICGSCIITKVYAGLGVYACKRLTIKVSSAVSGIVVNGIYSPIPAEGPYFV